MSKDINEEDFNEKDVAPILFSIKKKKIEAPEGYFDTFSDKVMNRIHAEEIPSSRITILNNRSMQYAIAASMILFIGFALSIYSIQQKETSKMQGDVVVSTEDIYIDEIAEEHLINYVDEINTSNNNDELDSISAYLNEEIILEEL